MTKLQSVKYYGLKPSDEQNRKALERLQSDPTDIMKTQPEWTEQKWAEENKDRFRLVDPKTITKLQNDNVARGYNSKRQFSLTEQDKTIQEHKVGLVNPGEINDALVGKVDEYNHE